MHAEFTKLSLNQMGGMCLEKKNIDFNQKRLFYGNILNKTNKINIFMMNKLRICFVVLTFFSFAFVNAQEYKNTINEDLEACLKQNESYENQLICYQNANKLWENEINKQIQALNSILYIDTKEILMEAHEKWLQYREQEFISIEDVYQQYTGAFYKMHIEKLKCEINKNRAEELILIWNGLHER